MRQQDIAYEIAQKAHEGQFRRDKKTPYFNHVQDALLLASSLCQTVREEWIRIQTPDFKII